MSNAECYPAWVMVGQVRVAPFLPLATLTFDVLTCGEIPENNENNEDSEDNAVIENTYICTYICTYHTMACLVVCMHAKSRLDKCSGIVCMYCTEYTR